MMSKLFTLVELLVVIAIIAILASMLLPALTSARNYAKDIKCMSNIKRLGCAGLMYATDYSDYWPLFYNKNGGSGCFWYNNYYFISPFIGKNYNGNLTGDYMIPPSLICPMVRTPTLVNGLATATYYGMNSQGLADAGVNPLYNSVSAGAYSMLKVVSPSAKLAHADAGIPGSNNGNWNLLRGLSTSSTAPRYRHKNNNAATVLFFDGHAAALVYNELYCNPRCANDCWDVYGATK